MYGEETIQHILPDSIGGREESKDFPISVEVRRRYDQAMNGIGAAHVFIKSITQAVNRLTEEPKTLQQLRDEVRMMVASRKLKEGIPLYQGRKIDGNPVEFLKRYYAEYLLNEGQHTLFLHDLRKIDNTLARAVEIDKLRTEKLIGTKSDMFKALELGLFTDGIDTNRRIKNARRNKETRNKS